MDLLVMAFLNVFVIKELLLPFQISFSIDANLEILHKTDSNYIVLQFSFSTIEQKVDSNWEASSELSQIYCNLSIFLLDFPL